MRSNPKHFPLLPEGYTSFGAPCEGALLLEGGSLRGVYTAGVCDVLMENGLHFQTVAGVSAGALNGMNVMVRQVGRFARLCILYRRDSRYSGWRAFLSDGGAVGFHFLLKTAEKIIPFDPSFLRDCRRRLVAVATDIETGEPLYIECGKGNDFRRALRASSSLAFASRIVRYEGRKLLDGGYTVSVPLEWAEAQGFDKKVVVLTGRLDARKPPVSEKKLRAFRRAYRRYPAFPEAVERVPERYNAQRAHLQEKADAGEVFVIAPSGAVSIGKMEKDPQKLYGLYLCGREDAQRALPALKAYLRK